MNTEIITPEIAKEMLSLNSGNRHISWPHVEYLAQQMRLGRWKENGETIKLNGSRLLDGQHRLHAVIKSNCSIKSLVVRGISSDVFDTIDTGKKRAASDVLSICGEKNTTNLAAALSLIERYYTGRMTSRCRFSNIDILEFNRKYPNVSYSVSMADKRIRRLTAQSVGAACHYIFSRSNKFDADKFFDDLASGANLDVCDPVYHLRERLVQNRASKAKLRADYIMALFIKAWNARSAGQQVKNLRYRTDGDSPESFPIAK